MASDHERIMVYQFECLIFLFPFQRTFELLIYYSFVLNSEGAPKYLYIQLVLIVIGFT